MSAHTEQIHATAVEVGGAGCLILGAPGTGKSTLALEMIALGARLVADDRVDLRTDGPALLASPPATLAGMIEARGVGLLPIPYTPNAQIRWVADLDQAATDRLPASQTRILLGVACPVIFGRDRTGLAAILVTILRHGGPLDPDATV